MGFDHHTIRHSVIHTHNRPLGQHPSRLSEDLEAEVALRAALEDWRAVESHPALDRRMLNTYQQEMDRVPVWKKIIKQSGPLSLVFAVSVGVLVAASVLVICSRCQGGDSKTH